MAAIATSSSPAALLSRARSSGRIPPSLLGEVYFVDQDGFGDVVARLIDDAADGLALRTDVAVADEFYLALSMARSLDSIPGGFDVRAKSSVLSQRRCILSAVIGSTPANSASLKLILNNGYLAVVKSWLEDILNGAVGGVDLLLHLLTSIAMLPVSKEMVTSSKLGKAVAAVEKHKICSGSMNEEVIKEKIAKVKEEWSASVKIMKQSADGGKGPSPKRAVESGVTDTLTKKAKTDDLAPKSSLSNLIKKVTTASNTNSLSSADVARSMAKERDTELMEQAANSDAAILNCEANTEGSPLGDDNDQRKNNNKHIKWADNLSMPLTIAHKPDVVDEEQKNPELVVNDIKTAGDVSWTDRKKRDRLREKELLLQARKSKLVDNEVSLETMVMMVSPWHTPSPLPPDPENPPVQTTSKEVTVQMNRSASIIPSNYMSEEDVPIDPAPLSSTEQALDLASQSSAVSATIPFYTPRQETTAPAPMVLPVQQVPIATSPASVPAIAHLLPLSHPISSQVGGASIDVLQAMGLPLFLVGQNVQALQTLAASPSLLHTFADASGIFDQPRLLNLVQTLAQSLPPAQPQQPAPVVQAPVSTLGTAYSTYNAPHSSMSHYGPAQTSLYQQPPQSSGYSTSRDDGGGYRGKGYRGDQNTNDGNLHVSGYGPMTTQAELLALFSPYVKVDEVVQKNGFTFVNTHDPDGARRAKDALNGSIVGGSPVRINIATRRNKDPSFLESKSSVLKSRSPIRSDTIPLPRSMVGHVDYNQVQDDRGNPATKNLFVAGYGQGTTEQQLRDLFGLHTTVTGTVIKGSFAFVNTSDKGSAIHAREALIGSVVNGGVLRINFAKESGRLGTSFDQTYGSGGLPRAAPSHYERGY